MKEWIHFIGSKGKGSSLHLLEKQAIFAGIPVMVFQSPWILEEREMFRENGEMLEEKVWEAGLAEQEGSPFERAWQATELRMKDSPQSLKLVECGWETPWDATASLPQEKWSIMTHLEEEHVELLGGSFEKIIESCMNLARPCEKLFCDKEQKKLLEHFEAPWVWTQAEENSWTHPMNLGLAKKVWQELGFTWQDEALQDWSLPGRFEKIHEGLYLDACHTLSSLSYALHLWQKIRSPQKASRILFHFLEDKNPQLFHKLHEFALQNKTELFWCPLNEARAGQNLLDAPVMTMQNFISSHSPEHQDLILGSFRLVALAKNLLPTK